MTRMNISALRRAITRRRTAAAPVHFHSGPHGQPAVCFDAACNNPRLDVR
jgi:hypothetical protein